MDALRLVRAVGIGAFIALSAVPALAENAASQDVVTGDLDDLRARALALTNESRRENGLAPLASGETLDTIAQSHAEDMLERGYFAHVSPDGEDVAERFHAAGGLRSEIVAENLGSCTGCAIPPDAARIEAFHEGWMESPEHRDNLLRRGIARFGFGIAADRESRRTIAVQTFAGPGVPRGLGAGETAATLGPSARAEAALEAVNALRGEADAPQLQASAALTDAARALLQAADREGADREPPELDIAGALAPEARGRFVEIAALAATCTGCGVEPTAADVAAFVSQWAEGRGGTLADPGFDKMGFALGADGAGAKAAVLVLGAVR